MSLWGGVGRCDTLFHTIVEWSLLCAAYCVLCVVLCSLCCGAEEGGYIEGEGRVG